MVKNPHCKLTITKSLQMMHEIKNQSDMNEAIAVLGQDKALQKQNLTEHIKQKVQSLDPSNLIKSVVGKVTTNPSMKKNLLLAAAGVATVLVLKKFSARKSGGKSLLFMALSGAGTILAKNFLAKHKQ